MSFLKNVIGQEAVKQEINVWLESYQSTNYMPHILLEAEKGNGKSHFAKEIGRSLAKEFVTIPSASVKNLTQLLQMFSEFQGQEVTFFFDECHGIKNQSVIDALLVILEPTTDRQTFFSSIDYNLAFDFTKQSFIFATTETQDLFEPFKDRMERFQLQSYSQNELAHIVALNLETHGIDCSSEECEDHILKDIAIHTRGNARAAYKISEKIYACSRILNQTRLDSNLWEYAKRKASINKLGLNKHEIKMLEELRSIPLSLGHIASKLGLPTQAVRRDLESHLLRFNLMRIDGKREITQEGRNYLKNIEESP